MQLEGKIKHIGPELQVSATFKKRELVVTTDEQYPQHIQVDFLQDKCDLLNDYNVGENVKVSINLAGKEWVNPQGETKYFNSIKGWRIEKIDASAAPPLHHSNHPTNMPPQNQAQPQDFNQDDEESDLPF